MKSRMMKLAGIILGLALVLGLMVGVCSSAYGAQPPVKYLDANGSEQTCNSYTVVTDNTTSWGTGWYVVNSIVTFNSNSYFSGDVNIILCDNAKLTFNPANGSAVYISSGSLTIYAQSTGNSMGELVASSNGHYTIVNHSGNITINGGKVTATASGNSSECCAVAAWPGKVTINGGIINATGYNTGIFASDNVEINGGTVTAQATSWRAIDGTVKNKIAGVGWTDASGSGNGTTIAVSETGQTLSDYKRLQFGAPAHTHSFTYSASGDTITATCGATGCTLSPSTDGGSDHVATLTIAAPTLTTYGGTGDATATLDGVADFNTATGKSLAVTNIMYVGRDGTEYTESTTAPTDAGKYTAKITLSGVKTSEGEGKSVTASVDYEIAATYPLWVGGERVTSANANNIDGGSKASYNAKTNTLTLNGYSYSDRGYEMNSARFTAVYYSGTDTLKIVLTGDNIISFPYNNSEAFGIFSLGDLEIIGNGSLTVTGENARYSICGVHTQNKLTIGGIVTVTATDDKNNTVASEGIATKTDGAIIIKEGAKVTATGNGAQRCFGITTGSFTINGEVTATGSMGNVKNYGLYIYDKLVVNKGKMTAEAGEGGESVGIYAKDVEINGGTVTAKAGKSTSESGYGIYAVDTINVTGGTLTATAGDSTGGGSFGICASTISLTGGTVSATGENPASINSDSYGLYALSGVTIGSGVTSVIAEGKTKAIVGTVINQVSGFGITNTQDGNKEYSHIPVNTSGEQVICHIAEFPSNKIPLEYNANGGAGIMEAIEVELGELYVFPECGFEAPKGNKFTYWDLSGVDGRYNPKDTEPIVKNCIQSNNKITVTANWKNAPQATMTVKPEAVNPAYNGKDQALVTAGETSTGIMVYKLSDSATAAPVQGWSTEIPAKTEPGTYYVWAKVAGDESHSDSDKVCVTANIVPKKVTITAKDANKNYDGTALTEAGFTASALEAGDTHTFTVTMTADSTLTEAGSRANVIATVDGTAVKTGEETAVGNYLVTTADGTLTVVPKITRTVTFKVENGAWDDGKTESKTATLEGWEGDTLKLAASDIPSAGTKPGDGYKEGGWEVAPVAGTAVTKDTTYTYKYASKDSIVRKVTFKVKNGSWDDGNAADITVTLEGLEGDVLKLPADKIPAAGKKPAETFKAGGWDKAPVADTEITADTTYTYTYAEKDPISATVTFRVVNGSWDDGTTEDLKVTLAGFEGDSLYLAVDDVPDVGSKPAEGYAASGKWDTEPSVADEELGLVSGDPITKDTTYTYTYAEKKQVSHTVTLKVVHGAWKDGTKADKTITLTGYEGDELRIPLSEMPGVTEPDEGYEFGTGTWSPSDPPIEYNGEVSGDPITEDTTFTYTYGEITTQLYAVTLKVVHGEWGDELGGRDDRTIFVEGPIGEELRLQFEQIPEVDKPDEGYTADTGSWDKEPPFILDGETYGDPITGDTVYTYTYGVEPEDPVMTSIKNFVKRMYEALLGREADESGLSSWSDLLKSGEASAAQIVRGFACSEEFILKYQTNGAIVRALYIAMLGREPDPEGLDAWANVLAENSPIETVINGLAGSAEFGAICDEYGILPGAVSVPAMTPDSIKRNKIEAFVKRCYFVILGRFPDEEGLKGWSDALQDHSAHAARIIEGFVCSEEFTNMKLSHEATVKVLYRAMLDRTADAEGLRDWTKALDDGYSLQHIINGFCGSVEFTRLCAEYGITPGRLAVAGTMVKREGIAPEGEEAAAVVVVQSEYTNEEKIRAFVNHCYKAVFGREGDAEGIGNYTKLILAGTKTPKSTAREFVFSAEFQSKLPGNEEFIRILYRLYFDREPGAEELSGWVKMLEDGATLDEIVNGFAGSAEFKAIVNEMK